MISRIDLRSGADFLPPRAGLDVSVAMEQVRPIVEAVRDSGYSAVLSACQSLDGIAYPDLRVPQSVIDDAVRKLPSDVKAALLEAIERTRKVHADQVRSAVTTSLSVGGVVTEKWIPIARVGLYVPGGKAVYPSSVVMNVVPAQVAGVESLVVVSPPQREFGGLPHPTVLAACGLLGVTEVYAVGGAQAIAMLAYGIYLPTGQEVEPVKLVTGPGNIYVTAAKRILKGTIGIDSEAGPTEIAILADHTANPQFVAADLISQAEHDVVAASVLVTTSVELADAVEVELEQMVSSTKHKERIKQALSGDQSAIILVKDLEQGIAVVNEYAAEHLEIQTADAGLVAERITNAGAIFVGDFSPVSLGDYLAGSNHVLPTASTAHYASGLSVSTFCRGVHIIDYNAAALAEVANHIYALSAAEDLPAHGAAVKVRFEVES